MYLVSLYFNEKTKKKIQRYMNQVAEKTGNRFMLDGNVPPHITISAFETQNEKQVINTLDCAIRKFQRGTLQWASVGQFFPYVIFIAPVLNMYLHEMSVTIDEAIKKVEGIQLSPYYQPFSWAPHSTIAKKLSKEEMQIAFACMQECFGAFEGEVVRIGLAKPNPHRDIASWELK